MAQSWRAICLPLMFLSGLGVSVPAQETRDLMGSEYPVGMSPEGVTTGDFNGDGIADLVVANYNSDSVSVLLGNGSAGGGDGTFAEQVTYAVGDGPRALTVGDFNGDGITDLVIANSLSDDVSVLLGNGSAAQGDGTFAAQSSFSVGNAPWGLTTGDFNGDGITDLAISNSSSDNVSVLLGNGSAGQGDGTFAAGTTFATGDSPRSVTTGDFNGDGITDLATANFQSNDLSVLLGVGDGEFSAHATFMAGEQPHSLTTGDFNRDGITDLAAANAQGVNVSVLIGKGSGGLGDGTFEQHIVYATGHYPRAIATLDFNRDGITDLVTANQGSDDLSVLLGNGSQGIGDGTFAAPLTYAAGEDPVSVASGDFNKDGIPDLVTANNDNNSVLILLGDGSEVVGDNTFASQITFGAGMGPRSITAGDYNGDGITDLATANRDSDDVSVLLGNGSAGNNDGTFAPHVTYAVGESPEGMTIGDFNGDGIADLIVVNRDTDAVSVLLGQGSERTGDGTFAPQVTYPVGDAPYSVATADFNGDGITDLAVTNAGTNNISVLLGQGTGGIGDGTFAAQTTYPVGMGPIGLTTGDFNSDGITDLAVTNIGFDNISVLLGNGTADVGDGTFSPQVTYPVARGPFAVTTGDFNADGITDLAVANINSNDVSILLGNGSDNAGDGTFAAAVNYPVLRNPISLATGDFNGDRITDLVVATIGSNSVSILRGNGSDGTGDGTFATPAPFAVGRLPSSVNTGDFNGDGIIDLAVSNEGSNTISILRNLGLGHPSFSGTGYILH